MHEKQAHNLMGVGLENNLAILFPSNGCKNHICLSILCVQQTIICSYVSCYFDSPYLIAGVFT